MSPAERPQLKLDASQPGKVVITFQKGDHAGVSIYSKRPNELGFTWIARDTQSPYVDNRPCPGGGEVREYHARYFKDTGRGRVEEGAISDDVTVTAFAKDPLNRMRMFLCLGGGFIVMLLFGIKTGWIDSLTNASGMTKGFEYWQKWEVGALVYNFLFACYFYIGVFPINKISNKKSALIKGISVAVIVGPLVFSILAVYCIYRQGYVFEAGHIFCILLVGLIFLTVDTLLAKHVESADQQQEYNQTALIADVPLVAAFSLLLAYQLLQGLGNDKGLDVFVAGAITFQLILSNVFLVLSAGGVFRRATRLCVCTGN